MYAARVAGWCSCLVVLLVFVKKLSCCVFLFVRLALAPLCGIMLRYRQNRRHIKQGDVLLFFIGAFVCQGGDIQKAHNVYYV